MSGRQGRRLRPLALAALALGAGGCNPYSLAGEGTVVGWTDEELCGRRSNLLNSVTVEREIAQRGLDCAPYDEAALSQGFRLSFLAPQRRAVLPPASVPSGGGVRTYAPPAMPLAPNGLPPMSGPAPAPAPSAWGAGSAPGLLPPPIPRGSLLPPGEAGPPPSGVAPTLPPIAGAAPAPPTYAQATPPVPPSVRATPPAAPLVEAPAPVPPFVPVPPAPAVAGRREPAPVPPREAETTPPTASPPRIQATEAPRSAAARPELSGADAAPAAAASAGRAAAAAAPFVTPACAARSIGGEPSSGGASVSFRNTCRFPIRVLYAERPEAGFSAATALLRPGETSAAAPLAPGFRQPGFVVCSYESVPESTPCRLQP